jgi:hypothetical protein
MASEPLSSDTQCVHGVSLTKPCEECNRAQTSPPLEERLRKALEDAADMLHECATECADCNYGNGATGLDWDGSPCEECAPIREAERLAREAMS